MSDRTGPGHAIVQLAPGREAWWRQAACHGDDPEWWADDRLMRPVAVEICLRCPVRRACLDDALRSGDYGVVRGGMLLVQIRRRTVAVPLVCAGCHRRPVRTTPTGTALYCGPTCAEASRRKGGMRPVTARPRRRQQPAA